MIKVGDLLQDRYTIVRPLGSGGFGAVWLATDRRLGDRQVAIKYFATSHMRPEEAESAARLFQAEAHILANLNHPNLADVLDYFEVADGWVLIMSYVPGETLAALQQRLNGPVGEEQVISWAIELCNVLEYLHRQKPPLIFRDLKPSNIMRTPDGKLILIDFGIVRTFKEGQHQDTIQLGTPGYAPPEQYGGQTEPRSDIYSLGATMYVLLTAQRLVGGFEIPPVREAAPWVSAGLEQLVRHMTALRPQERPASMTMVREALERLLMQPAAAPVVVAPSPAMPQPQPVPRVGRGGVAASPSAQTTMNPAIRAKPGPQAPPVQPQRQPPPPAHGLPARPQTGTTPWPLLLVVLVLLGGLGGAAYAFRDSLFGSSDAATASAVPIPAASNPDSLIITSFVGGGSNDLLYLPLNGGTANNIVPDHADNAIGDRRDTDGAIVYTHGVESGGKVVEQIFRIGGASFVEQQLTQGSSINRVPRWSFDGSQIVFESNRDQIEGNPRDVYLMNDDGTDVSRLTADPGWQGGPALSPDGRQVAYHSQPSSQETFQIVVLDLETNQQRVVAKLDDDAFYPDWSPDGQTLAFMTERGNTAAIYTVPAAGGTPERLNLGDGIQRWPRWSPDGTLLAFEAQRNGRWQVFILTLATDEVRLISDGTRNDRWPGW